MTSDKLAKLIKDLSGLPTETEWIEFKRNYARPDEIGENISALSNSTALLRKHCGFIIWGIEDDSHAIVGTDFLPNETRGKNSGMLSTCVPAVCIRRTDDKCVTTQAVRY